MVPAMAAADCPQGDACCRVLKTASILNNTAIHLLERQEYPQALRRFQQATQLLKDLAGYLEGESMTIPPDPCEIQMPTPSPPLSVTTQATAMNGGGGSFYPMTPPPHTSFGGTMEQQVGPTISLISTEFDPSSFHNALATATTTTASSTESKVTLFPFLMDLSTCNLRNSNNDESATAPLEVDFYSSVVLYNYAIAYQCLAQTVTTVTAAAYFQRKAQRILSLSSHLLDLQLRDEWGLPKIQCTDGRILQLQAFVTYQLMQMCVVYNLAVDYYHFCAKLEEVLLSIDILERLLTTRDYCAAVA
jgi:hypothetical protein